MLWLCIHLPHWPLEALAPPDAAPAAVIVTEQHQRRIVACNTAAEQAGLKGVERLTTALALYPRLRVLERSAAAERQALKRLAAWGYQWSSRVTWSQAQPHAVDYAAALWLEIGASRALFNGYRALLKQIEGSLQHLGYRYRLGVAPTLEGAALLARANRRTAIVRLDRLLDAIRELPIAQLAIAPPIAHALRRSGVETVGALFDLPAASLARRFGPELVLYLDRLAGRASDPRRLYRPPNVYAARCDFGFAVRSAEALLFPLQRMLHEFCGYLRALDVAAQHCAIVLEHERGAGSRIELGMGAPNRDAQRMLALAKEKLLRVTLTAEVRGLRIEAGEFTPPAVRQSDLFSRDADVADELQQAIEKIAARLGGDAVRAVQPGADHRPEQAWLSGSVVAQSGCAAPDTPPPAAPRPLWLLRAPRRLRAAPAIAALPERIESGWWSAPVTRDYYTVRIASGEAGWIFYDRGDGCWYVQGYWA